MMNTKDKIIKLKEASRQIDNKISELYKVLEKEEANDLNEKYAGKFIKVSNNSRSMMGLEMTNYKYTYYYVISVKFQGRDFMRINGVGFNVELPYSDAISMEFYDDSGDGGENIYFSNITIIDEDEVKQMLEEVQNRVTTCMDKFKGAINECSRQN